MIFLALRDTYLQNWIGITPLFLLRSEGSLMPSTNDNHAKEVGERLDEVAKFLTGALVAVAGVLAALGMTSDRVFVALNNSPTSLVIATLLAVAAITCSILALFCKPTPGGNKLQLGVLALGVILYIASLAVSVSGAANQASGNGRPTITDVKVAGDRPKMTLNFTVRADGVKRENRVAVFIRPQIRNAKGEFEPATEADVYSASLRPNSDGVVDQVVSMPLRPGNATYLNFSVSNSGDRDKSKCETDSSKAPACVKMALP
ncbi:hypothetical protein [Streptomyces sp. Root369]|uniref:hypothetical protein n=1 Tax=Streptomyces sp. Root369 TaxID=1736523 RepID=UPI001301457B|nr:hypothetical protein [Streptomyces sp. Root369]